MSSETTLSPLDVTYPETIFGTEDADYIDRSDAGGSQIIRSRSGNDTLIGSAYDDTIRDYIGDNLIDAGAGDDVIEGNVGADTITGGTGADTIIIGGREAFYEDSLNGAYQTVTDFELGTDMIALRRYGTNDTTVFLSTLADFDGLASDPGFTVTHSYYGTEVVYDSGTGTLSFFLQGVGSLPADTIVGGDGPNKYNRSNQPVAQDIKGMGGDDTITTGGFDDTIEGNQGNDSIKAGNGDDFVQGGKDNDTIYGLGGYDTLYGNNDDDEIYGGTEDDFIWGGDGDDYIDGGSQRDYIDAGDGNDTVLGGKGRDTVDLGDGDDAFRDNAQGVGTGNDVIDGGAGDDTITIRGGNDTVTGGTGTDVIEIGAGTTFADTALKGSTITVTDFEADIDTLILVALDGGADVSVSSLAEIAALDGLDDVTVTDTTEGVTIAYDDGLATVIIALDGLDL